MIKNKEHIKRSITSGYTILKHANLQTLSDTLGCKLSCCSKELQTSLAIGVRTPTAILEKRQRVITTLRKQSPPTWDARFQRAAAIEADLTDFFKTSASPSKGKDDLEEDALGQLSFQHWALKPLNHLPFMIAVLAMFKVWVVPIMTVMTPLIAWILPYILLKFVYSLPINQSQYFTILRSLWSGHFSSPFPGPNDPLPSLFTPKSLMQFIVFGFSFLQGIIQPIQNAMHLHNTDKVFVDLGTKLLELRGIVEDFRGDLPDYPLADCLKDLDPTDVRRGFIEVVEEPGRVEMIFSDLARLEILWRISQATPLFQPALFLPEDFYVTGLADLSLHSTTHPITTEITLDASGQNHAVVTGPNGGGKSSFLRAVLQTVLLAHTYGFGPAKAIRIPRFRWIASGLELRDTPGTYSMFETEVKFAAQTLKHAYDPQTGPGLVLFDELFHSTNPPDGTRTADLFLGALWKVKSIFSIVSTHVFPLIESAPSGAVKAICCPATVSEKGEIQYSYRIEPGICKVSSVKKVWERFGLWRPVAPRPGGSGQNLQAKEN